MCEYNGLNLTLAVREGILKQTKNIDKNGLINYPEKNYDNIDLSLPSFTLEGQVAAIADEVAQCTHDLEDGVRSKIISYNDVKSFPIIQTVIQTNEEKNNTLSSSPAYDIRNYVIWDLIGLLINDICVTSLSKIDAYITNYKPVYTSLNTCINEKCICFSNEMGCESKTLYEMITNKVICSDSISAADAKSEYIIKQLFSAYFTHPKQLPDYVLTRYYNEN